MLKGLPLKSPYLFATIASVIAIGFISYWELGASQKKNNKTHPVAVVKVERQNLSQEVTLTAEFQPFRQSTLYAKVAGYLKVIHVDIGDRVKEGQILALLDTPEIRADLEKCKARYEETKLDYERIYKVSQQRPGLVAQDEVDKAKEAYDVAKANRDRAQTLLDYATIKAPFDGIITKRYVDEGALIQEGSSSSTQAKPVVDLAEDTKLRLVFPVPETIVKTIKVGNPVELTIQATGQVIKGVIARSTGKVDHATRTMETEVDVENKDLKLTPGMYAYVKLGLAQKNNVLALPVQAINTNHEPLVWYVNEHKEVEKRKIKIGLQTPEMIEVTNGLKENDLVVYGNHDTIEGGVKVEPQLIKIPHTPTDQS